ncbi:MAG: cytochrome c-type biogenesis CcmF C-terminal domain-containing protein, partial [Porticoccaceae bacterium]
PPYFNFFFVPLSVGLVVALGIAVFTKWKTTNSKVLLSKIPLPLVIAIVGAAILPWVMGDTDSGYSVTAALTLLLTLWLLATIVIDLKDKIGTNIKRVAKLSRSYLGMQLAHSGLAILVLGVGMSAAYDSIRELRMAPGDSAVIADYQFDFKGVNPVAGPNFTAYRGQITVTKADKLVANLFPEKRQYNAGGQVMTEAAIDPSLMRDIYVSLGEPLAQGAWAVSLQVKPFVRCIWLGGILIGIGGLIAATDRRYRRSKKLANHRGVEA